MFWFRALIVVVAIAPVVSLPKDNDKPMLPQLDPSQVQQFRRDSATPTAKNSLPPQAINSGVLVSFEGGNVGESIAQVLQRLIDINALPDENYTVQPKDTICSLLDRRGYPPPCPPLLKILDQLNLSKRLSTRTLQPGEIIKLPALEVRSAVAIKPVPGGVQREVGDCVPPVSSDRLLKNWSRLQPRVVDCVPGSIGKQSLVSIVQYRAYQLLIPTSNDDLSLRLLNDLETNNNPNIRFDLIPHSLPAGTLNQLRNSEQLRDACAKGLANNPPYIYSELFDYDHDAVPTVREGLAPGGVAKTPRPVPIYLIDTDVARAPNLYPAYGDTAPGLPWNCRWKTPFLSRYHATHLASLIASQDNGYGFRSLASNTVIFPYIWNIVKDDDSLVAASRSRHIELQQSISINADAIPGMSRAIYVAATSFDLIKLKPIGAKLSREELRWEESVPKSIKTSPSLFIFSAGQAEKGEAPVELSTTSVLTPQHLGDLPNVIVVTACTDCSRTKTNLMPEAHFGSGINPIVHVAAPGGTPIPGWVTAEEIGAGSGTSQATALVAGVAAAMLGAWPDGYSSSQAIKSRLQVTSRPIPPNGDGSTNPAASKIAAGVVDPFLALLDPTRHWLKQGGTWQSVKIRAVNPKLVQFVDDDGAHSQIASLALRRIVTMPNGAQVAYINDAIEHNTPLGTVQRIGPTRVDDAATLILCDNPKALPLSSVQDLIIALGGVRPNECP